MEAVDGDEETRECIRRLVSVIKSSTAGDLHGPDHAQRAHIKKVVRLLSLSQDQISSMRPEERAQVMSIRRNAIRKMRMANSVRSSGSSPRSSFGSPSSSSPGMMNASPPLPPESSGYSSGTSTSTISIGTSSLSQSPLSFTSAPSTRDAVFGVEPAPSPPSCAMPPPSFYMRKDFSPSSAKPAAWHRHAHDG